MAEEQKPGIIYLGTAAELGWNEDSQPSKPLTNWDRADRAATALAAYHDEAQGCDPGLGQSYGDEGEGVFSEAFQDLLTDLMHLADRAGLEFEDLINRAVVNYDAENAEEESVRGCSCGMADYGAPGHDHDEKEGSNG